MASFVVRGTRGSRKNIKPTAPTRLVNSITNSVPRFRYLLPFVYDARGIAIQNRTDVHLGKLTRLGIVECNPAIAMGASGPRFARPHCARNFYSPERFQMELHRRVNKSRPIRHAINCFFDCSTHIRPTCSSGKTENIDSFTPKISD